MLIFYGYARVSVSSLMHAHELIPFQTLKELIEVKIHENIFVLSGVHISVIQ